MVENSGRKVAIFLYWRSQFWLDAIASLISSHVEFGDQVMVVDGSHLHLPKQAPWSIGGRVIRPAGIQAQLEPIFANLGASYMAFPKESPNFEALTPEDLLPLQIAVNSSMNNTFRSSFLGGQSWLERLVERRMLMETKRVFSSATLFLRSNKPDLVYVTNGRLSSQRAISLACEKLEIEPRFLEHSEFPGGLFNRSYRPHDRIAFQADSMAIAKELDPLDVEGHVANWTGLRRAARSVTNPFNSRWQIGHARKEVELDGRPIALFLTSSSDEFESLDLDWKEGEWDNQYAAFESTWQSLKTQGFRPVLRIHPNLGNKKPSDALHELRLVKKFHLSNKDFRIFDHNSRVSTYELVALSSVIVVYNSTVGLEASLESKHTITLNSCWYDNCADVLKVHSEAALREIPAYLSRQVVPAGAKQWIAAQAALDAIVPRSSKPALGQAKFIIQVLRSILDNSLFWLLFEKRWSLYRLATKLLVVRDGKASGWIN